MTTEMTTTQKPSLKSLSDSMLRMESMMDKMAQAILSLNDRVAQVSDRVSQLESLTPAGKAAKVAPSKVQPKKSSTASPTEKPYVTVHPYSDSFSKISRSWGLLWCYRGTIGLTVGKPNPEKKRVVKDDPFETSQFKAEVSALSKREWKYSSPDGWKEGLKALFEELELVASYASDGEASSFKVSFRKYAEDDFRVALYKSYSDKPTKTSAAPF